MGREAQPWERRPDETAAAFRAFAVYRDLGTERSITSASEKLGKHPSQLKKWSTVHHWQPRVRAFDAAEDELVRKRTQSQRWRAQERRLKVAGMAMDRVSEAIEASDASSWSPADLARVFRVAAQVEEQVLSPTDTGSAGADASLALTVAEFDLMSDEERIARMFALHAEIGARLQERGPLVGVGAS